MNKLYSSLFLMLFSLSIFAQIQMEIDGTDSKIGIGTETPLFNLDVHHPTGIPTIINHNGFNLRNAASNGNHWTFYVNNGTGALQLYKNFTRVGQFNPTDGEYTDIQPSSLRRNVKPLTNQLAIIKRLQPTTFDFGSRNQTHKMYGFAAQKVQKIIPDIIRETGESNENLELAISYKRFIPIIIAAMQEQQAIIEQQQTKEESLEQQLALQQAQINDLQKMLSKLLAPSKSPDESTGSIILKDQLKLEQNHPNPFSQSTTINYFLPSTLKNAHLIITNLNGQLVAEYPIQQTGSGKIIVDSRSFTNGTYFYSLKTEGQIINTKKMMINN